MPEHKLAAFTASVYGVAFKHNGPDEPTILVNVPLDQRKQKSLARLPDNWRGLIVDLPGGQVEVTDTSLEECLVRWVKRQTGCTAKIAATLPGPYPLMDLSNPARPVRDMAQAFVITLSEEPQATQEIDEHRWVTLPELANETEVRFRGKRGKEGRMFQIAQYVIDRVKKRPSAVSSVPDLARSP